MKKIFILFSLCFTVLNTASAHNGLEQKPKTVIAVIAAPPAQTLAMTALQESATFNSVFKSILQQAAKDIYDANWNTGTQTPNSTEGRRLKFAKLILEGDSKSINFCKAILISNNFSYSVGDDNQFKSEIRDNFTNNFDPMAGSF